MFAIRTNTDTTRFQRGREWCAVGKMSAQHDVYPPPEALA